MLSLSQSFSFCRYMDGFLSEGTLRSQIHIPFPICNSRLTHITQSYFMLQRRSGLLVGMWCILDWQVWHQLTCSRFAFYFYTALCFSSFLIVNPFPFCPSLHSWLYHFLLCCISSILSFPRCGRWSRWLLLFSAVCLCKTSVSVRGRLRAASRTQLQLCCGSGLL